MERREAEAVYEQGRDAVVSVLLALSAQNERLEAQVEKLTARVARQDERIATLERELGRSSRNSSQPPSAGADSWFWLDPPPSPRQVSVAEAGERVTVTATPATSWRFDDRGSNAGAARERPGDVRDRP